MEGQCRYGGSRSHGNRINICQNFDTGIAAEAFCLAAYERGLGTVILGIFDENKAAEVLNIPDDRGVAAFIVIGHPAVNPEAPKRKEVSELLTFLS